MTDFAKKTAADAQLTRDILGGDTGKTTTIYNNREALRVVRVNEDNTIDTLVGQNWKSSFVSPVGLRKIMVR